MVNKYFTVFECTHDYQIENLTETILARFLDFLVESTKFCPLSARGPEVSYPVRLANPAK